jgi:hypothetical protein
MRVSGSVGQFKQEVLRVYNEINKRIFNCGVKRQKVEVVGNKIVIISINARIPVLKMIDEYDRSASRRFDLALQDRFKAEIRQAFEHHFKLPVVAVLKDYDVKTEHSGTIVILERELEQYLNER